MAEAKKLIAGGYREIVLTGINTALYEMEQIRPDEAGRLPEEPYGVEKVIAALSDIPGDFRIRLSSLEPAVVDADYVKRLLSTTSCAIIFTFLLRAAAVRCLRP